MANAPGEVVVDAVEPVNVLLAVGMPLPEGYIHELEALSPRVQVRLLTQEERSFLLRPGGADEPAPAAARLREALAEAEVVFMAVTQVSGEIKGRVPKLRWFQTTAAGIDSHIRAGVLDWGVLFTKGRGPAGVPIAEFNIMLMLMLLRNAATYVRNQDRALWEKAPGSELRGKTVGIVGLGEVGSVTARLARAFGCRVIGTRHSATEARENADGVDLLLPPHDLPRLLSESDFVVLAAPATPETESMINAETLKLMKRTAFLINIARGTLIDEDALIAALKAGEIAGAGLDVFRKEPLPPESEFWRLKQVLVTPHVSFLGESWLPGQLSLFKENLRRYLAGEPLLNLVSKELGY